MPNNSPLDKFLAASPYTEPVDRKKLMFIHGEVAAYAARLGVSPADLDVLEIACGVGGITLPMATLGSRIRALDIDEADVDELKNEAQKRGLDNLTVTVEDARRFENDGLYDVIIASEVFEHVPDSDLLAGVIGRHTKPGGLLIVTTPNGYGPWELSQRLNPWFHVRRWNWLRRRAGKQPYVWGAGRDHCHRFTRGHLLKLFAAHAFRLSGFARSDFMLTIFRPLRRNRFLGGLDTRMADTLPYWMASGWYMTFLHDPEL